MRDRRLVQHAAPAGSGWSSTLSAFRSRCLTSSPLESGAQHARAHSRTTPRAARRGGRPPRAVFTEDCSRYSTDAARAEREVARRRRRRRDPSALQRRQLAAARRDALEAPVDRRVRARPGRREEGRRRAGAAHDRSGEPLRGRASRCASRLSTASGVLGAAAGGQRRCSRRRALDAVKVETGNLDEACRGVDSTAKVAPPTAPTCPTGGALARRTSTNGLCPPPEPVAAPMEAAGARRRRLT